jgi:hypothetical protein
VSWNLIKSIQSDTDLRLILPFGLALRLGDVISVGKNGGFTLEGKCESLLGIAPGTARDGKAMDLMRQSGENTSLAFRAEGEASTLFEQLPSANAGFDVAFGSQNGWVLAATGRSLASLTELDKFRRPILKAYSRGVWKADWALVTTISTAKRMTLLASRTRNTKVALSLNGKIAADAGLDAKLTAGASILATSSEIISCITTEPGPVFCEALRVRDKWWKPTGIGTLAEKADAGSPEAAPEQKFWENVDDLGPSAGISSEL